MDASFWRGKRVFVTGHSGFKGAWLCVLLRQMGAEVTGLSLDPPSQPSLAEVIHLDELVTSRRGDVRSMGEVQSALEQSSAEIVIHMAAQSLVRESYRDPITTYITNVIGTANVLQAARSLQGLRVIVNVTSDKCYENRESETGYQETDALGGYDPYSNSKACAELVTDAFRKSFYSPSAGGSSAAVASVRAGNVIGGGDWGVARLMPDLVRSFSQGKEAVIRYPNAVRPWQHVLEPLSGYLTVAEFCWRKGSEYAEAWNFGPAEESMKPVSWVADRFAQSWGTDAKWVRESAVQPHETTCLRLDSTKAHQRLNWEPCIPIEKALEWTVEWYREFYDGADARTLTTEQVRTYLSLR